jgi:hypothetical protein
MRRIGLAYAAEPRRVPASPSRRAGVRGDGRRAGRPGEGEERTGRGRQRRGSAQQHHVQVRRGVDPGDPHTRQRASGAQAEGSTASPTPCNTSGRIEVRWATSATLCSAAPSAKQVVDDLAHRLPAGETMRLAPATHCAAPDLRRGTRHRGSRSGRTAAPRVRARRCPERATFGRSDDAHLALAETHGVDHESGDGLRPALKARCVVSGSPTSGCTGPRRVRRACRRTCSSRARCPRPTPRTGDSRAGRPGRFRHRRR